MVLKFCCVGRFGGKCIGFCCFCVARVVALVCVACRGSEYPGDLGQAVDLVCGAFGGVGFGVLWVEVEGVYACVFGSEYVGLEVVAYHERGLACGVALGEGVVEILLGGLVGSCVFAEYYCVEAVSHAAGCEFLVLDFVEAVGAEVQAVALLSEVCYELVCSFDDAALA